jgi:hypothetical protein
MCNIQCLLEILLHNFMTIHIPIHINIFRNNYPALEEATATLDRMMPAYLSQAEEDKQSFEETKNSLKQSFGRMEAHFKQISNILKEEKCRGQLVANPYEYYMDDECTSS